MLNNCVSCKLPFETKRKSHKMCIGCLTADSRRKAEQRRERAETREAEELCLAEARQGRSRFQIDDWDSRDLVAAALAAATGMD